MEPHKHKIARRSFLKSSGLAAPLLLLSPQELIARGRNPFGLKSRGSRAYEKTADLVIIGGGLGGCATALAAARHGLRVIMTEQTEWIGGQLTSQAVPPDENPWIESFGANRGYQTMRQKIRDYYRRNYPLTQAARDNPRLNPGNGSVSALCHEPRVALAVLQEMLAPFVASKRLEILLRHTPVDAGVNRDTVHAVRLKSEDSGSHIVLRAPLFVDATETGDLLPLTGTEYVTGTEAASVTGEPHAAATADPLNMQAFTCCFAMDYLDGEDHTVERPAEYSFWRDFVPPVKPAWPGRLLDLTYSNPRTLKPRDYGFDPVNETGFFRYRRIIDRKNFVEGTYAGGITLVNWPQNDYLLGNLFENRPADAAKHLARAKQLSLSWLYWLQTEAPRPDGGTGWKGLRPRRDLVGTKDGLALHPYIRESRRIRAEFTVLEQHVGTEARMAATGASRDEVRAAEFSDSVGIGSYRIDLHPGTGGNNYIDIGSLPFQIPLGALIPQRVENLLPACKNIGVTHITNGCYRLHPVEWNIGEAVGMLAGFCSDNKRTPREVRANQKLLAQFQHHLTSAGVRLKWPRNVGPR